MSEPHIADKLRDALLDRMKDGGLDLLRKSTVAVQEVLNCTEVSLWTINRNITQDNWTNNSERGLSTSLIARSLNSNCHFVFEEKKDYTHSLTDKCYFRAVIQNKKPYILYDKEEALASNYKSVKFIWKANINNVIAILITNKDYNEKDSTEEIIAILELSYSQKCFYNSKDWDILTPILSDYFSSAFKHYIIYQQQYLLEDLINLQDKHKYGTIEDLFKDVVKIIQFKYCPCQGASFFMWDSFSQCYKLIYTTGLVEINRKGWKKDYVSYRKGEKWTGKTGTSGKIFISNEFDKKLIFNEDVMGDKEITSENHIETGMFIPIAYPNDSKEVVGILRLINKTNRCNPKYVDYFNYEIDGKTMAIASKYLALVCNYYIRQDEQEIFINKLTHELYTPANAILKQADLLYKFRNDEGFIERYQNAILEDIKSLAQMQKLQVGNNLQLSRRRKQLPLNLKYNLSPHNLFGIIQDSKNIVIPIARRYNVQFEKIQIDNNLKQFTIRVDRHAFITIFYNLLTNSIKYHDPNDEFRIFIGGRITNEVLRITIEDNGIGINKNEVNDIFNIGYRGENAINLDAHGLGLGLSIIKQIIDDFDGNINISNLKKPTIFIIDLPKKIIYE